MKKNDTFTANVANINYLKEKQYAGTKNLRKRGNLHATYSTAKTPWFEWVFDQIAWEDVSTVLECGAGGGWLWQHTMPRLKADVTVTLTDLTDGMVEELAQLAESDSRFSAEPTDIQNLPYPDNSFDCVIANHMLYHVPDIAQGLREVRRVLKPNGILYAATNGAGHLQELTGIGDMLSPDEGYTSPGERLAFNLENGANWLRDSFGRIEMRPYPDALHVTDPIAITDYLESVLTATESGLQTTRAALQKQIDRDGYVHITKAVGLFVAAGDPTQKLL